MEHIDFKLKQAAAAYVAHGLNDTDMEDFEIHMMGCAECVEDIEVWRAIKQGIPKMPRQNPVEGTSRRYSRAEWPFAMAASMVGVGVISALGGWVMKGNLIPDLDSARTVVFNLPPVSRSAGECFALQVAVNTEWAVIRIPNPPLGTSLVALDSQMREISASQYKSRTQPDGSQLLRIMAARLDGHAVHLELRSSDSSGDPLGCITAKTTRAPP
jgi:hypothetical protein